MQQTIDEVIYQIENFTPFPSSKGRYGVYLVDESGNKYYNGRVPVIVTPDKDGYRIVLKHKPGDLFDNGSRIPIDEVMIYITTVTRVPIYHLKYEEYKRFVNFLVAYNIEWENGKFICTDERKKTLLGKLGIDLAYIADAMRAYCN